MLPEPRHPTVRAEPGSPRARRTSNPKERAALGVNENRQTYIKPHRLIYRGTSSEQARKPVTLGLRYTRSMTTAMPCPTPMHRLTTA